MAALTVGQPAPHFSLTLLDGRAISLSEFKGKQYVDLRVYFENDDGEWKPTKKGVAIHVDLFGKLMEALKEAEQMLQENGLLPPPEEA